MHACVECVLVCERASETEREKNCKICQGFQAIAHSSRRLCRADSGRVLDGECSRSSFFMNVTVAV